MGGSARRRAGDAERVVDLVPLGRASALGLGDDGVLGGFGAGVARREPARDGDGVCGGEGDATPLEEGRKEDYMYALAKPHGPCGGSQRERHAQANQKPKQRHKTPKSIV